EVTFIQRPEARDARGLRAEGDADKGAAADDEVGGVERERIGAVVGLTRAGGAVADGDVLGAGVGTGIGPAVEVTAVVIRGGVANPDDGSVAVGVSSGRKGDEVAGPQGAFVRGGADVDVGADDVGPRGEGQRASVGLQRAEGQAGGLQGVVGGAGAGAVVVGGGGI